jgi:hypothetical protein
MSATSWQLTFDARDPHAQADFWAAALGYQVEDNSERIDRLIEAGYASESDTVLHNGVRAWNVAEAIRGDGPRILFQTVPEDKTAKNRVHLDLNVGADRLDEERGRLAGLGATELAEVNDRGSHHFVMRDPEGNEFCVQ